MNSFQIAQTLATHTRFTVFEARGESFQFPVVLKRCEYREAHEAEFFIRSALMKTKAKTYSQPLLSIFADVDEAADKFFIVFVWRKGDALDSEVERDEESQFPAGKAGYGKSEVLYKDPLTKQAVKRALCLTLGKEVVLKVSKHANMLEMNTVFKEALVQAKCAHPNVCEFLDFRLYFGKSGHHTSYIVTESLKQNLVVEMQEREFRSYDEVELMTILQGVIAALLNAKRQNLAHQDIKPYNILRGPQGVKLTAFGATSSTEMYISPEAWEAMDNPKMQQRPFESDIFSLGMTILHLAATELPKRTPAMSCSELQALLQRKVQALRYSEELKRLLAAMLSTAPSDRPPLETLQMDAERIYRQATQELAQEALRLAQQARMKINEGKNAKAIELAAAAHAIYSRLPEDKDTAINLRNWGLILDTMGRRAEAMEKYAAAHAIYSRLPDNKDTASDLSNWGDALRWMGRSAEAAKRYAAAHAIYTRLPEDKDTADNLGKLGDKLRWMTRSAEAVKRNAAAHAIYTRLPEDKDTADNLGRWGDQLRWKRKSAKVVRKSAKVVVRKSAAFHAIYTRLPEDKDTADNLGRWVDQLRCMTRSAGAVKRYSAAHAIYTRLPEDKDTADNLGRWGDALIQLRKSKDVMEKYSAAHAVCSRLSENKDIASFLKEWGDALRGMGKNDEAIKKYAAAHATYSRFSKDKNIAKLLKKWGNALREMGKNDEAIKKYAAAHATYSRFSKDKNIAKFLKKWGDALREMGRSEEAIEKYETSRAFYVLCNRDYWNSDTRDCDAKIARLS